MEIFQSLKRSNAVLARLPDFDINEVWNNVMDDTIKNVASIEKIEDGMLYLIVKDSVWLTELSLLKDKLIENINNEAKKTVIKDIKFKAGSVRKSNAPHKIAKHYKNIPLPVELQEELDKALKNIEDNDLKKTLETIFKKSYSIMHSK